MIPRSKCKPKVARKPPDFWRAKIPLGTLLCNALPFSVDIPTPRSSATCLRPSHAFSMHCRAMVSPLVSAIRTASCLNSSVRFSHIVCLLCCSKCYQRNGIKPRQAHVNMRSIRGRIAFRGRWMDTSFTGAEGWDPTPLPNLPIKTYFNLWALRNFGPPCKREDRVHSHNLMTVTSIVLSKTNVYASQFRDAQSQI